jgi:glycosyltransferase involved in cell wall biosynthesis
MIVKNEEKTLPVCLESVKAIIDEIIIIDTGSTDKTVEIAQLYGAKVYSFGWIDDFSAARNESLRYASGDWILYLDADERITPENAAKIRGVIKNPDITAVNMIEHIPQEEGNLFKTTASDYCRLFRNDPRIRFSGRVHEQILPAVNAIGGNVLKSSIRIDHWGYAVSETKRTERARRNLSLLLKDIGDNPDDPFVWFNIGLAYKTLGNTEEAINALTKAVELPDDTMKHTIRSSTYTALAQLCFAMDNLESAENYALQALTLEKSNPLAHYILAGTAFQKEQYKEAETTLRTIATLAEAGALSVEINRAQLYFDIGNCLFKLQQYSEAADVYKNAAALDLNLFEAHFNTGICMMKLHNLVEAQEYFKRASELQPDNDIVIQLLGEIEQIVKP